jgi:tRNA pseudouridine13 synthase
VSIDGVEVLEAVPHRNKLKPGHLKGNRFAITLRDVPPGAAATAAAVLDAVQRRGLPNLYGEQRFGAGGDNAERARALLRGRGRGGDRREARFLLSALQSQLFNTWLALRLTRDLYDRPLAGDLMRKRETGGLFVSGDPATDGPRMAAGEIDPTGPMHGSRMRRPAADADALEVEALAAEGFSHGDFAPLGKRAPGSRRPMRVPVTEVAVREEPGALVLDFVLPAGSYATILLREVTKYPIPEIR